MLGKPHGPICTLGFQCPDSGYNLTTECQNGQRPLIDLITEVRFRFQDIIQDLSLFFLIPVTPKDASVSILTGVQQVNVYESTIINLYRVLPQLGESMEELSLQLKQRVKANGKAVDSLNEQALDYERFLYPDGNPFLAQLKNDAFKESHPE